MGIYINPTEMTKTEWLEQYGDSTLSVFSQKHIDLFEEKRAERKCLVVLVDNGAFFAAGVAYNIGEANAFAYPDERRKYATYVPVDDIIKHGNISLDDCAGLMKLFGEAVIT